MARQRSKQIEGTVLIADDHEVLRFGLVQLLRKQFGVTTALQAGSFQDALARLDEMPVELAIFDIGMPGLDSPSNLIEVRRRHPKTRVVVLSASENRDDILAALEAGVHGYIIKSARMDLVVERLTYILSGEIYVPPLLAEQAAIRPAPLAPEEVRPAAQHSLSDRQRQVLEGLVNGHSNKQIARELKLAEGTVKMHIGALFRALGASNRAHAAALGRKLLD